MQLELNEDINNQKSTREQSSHKPSSSIMEETQLAATQLLEEEKQVSILQHRNLTLIENLDKKRQETYQRQKKEQKEKKLEEKFKVSTNLVL